MAVQTDQLQVRIEACSLDRSHCLAGFQCKAEFAVNAAGLDKIMGMCVNAGLDAEHHICDRTGLPGNPIEPRKLRQIITDDSADTARNGHLQLGIRLAVSVHHDLVRGHTGFQRGIQLAAGNHIRAEPLGINNAVQLLAGERLARIADEAVAAVFLGNDRFIAAAVFTDHILIHDIERRAVRFRKLHGIRTADAKMALCVDCQIRCQHFHHPFMFPVFSGCFITTCRYRP